MKENKGKEIICKEAEKFCYNNPLVTKLLRTKAEKVSFFSTNENGKDFFQLDSLLTEYAHTDSKVNIQSIVNRFEMSPVICFFFGKDGSCLCYDARIREIKEIQDKIRTPFQINFLKEFCWIERKTDIIMSDVVPVLLKLNYSVVLCSKDTDPIWITKKENKINFEEMNKSLRPRLSHISINDIDASLIKNTENKFFKQQIEKIYNAINSLNKNEINFEQFYNQFYETKSDDLIMFVKDENKDEYKCYENYSLITSLCFNFIDKSRKSFTPDIELMNVGNKEKQIDVEIIPSLYIDKIIYGLMNYGYRVILITVKSVNENSANVYNGVMFSPEYSEIIQKEIEAICNYQLKNFCTVSCLPISDFTHIPLVYEELDDNHTTLKVAADLMNNKLVYELNEFIVAEKVLYDNDKNEFCDLLNKVSYGELIAGIRDFKFKIVGTHFVGEPGVTKETFNILYSKFSGYYCQTVQIEGKDDSFAFFLVEPDWYQMMCDNGNIEIFRDYVEKILNDEKNENKLGIYLFGSNAFVLDY